MDSITGGSTPHVLESSINVKSAIPVTKPLLEVSGSYEYNIKGTNFSGCFYKSF